MHAVSAATDRDLVFCDVSAAVVLGLPWLGPVGDEVHVCMPIASGGRSENGVRRHPRDLTGVVVQEVDGFLVTGVAHTAVELAARLPFAQGLATIDAALAQRNHRRTSPGELRSAVSRLGPRANARGVAAIVQLGSAQSDSYGESYCRAVMHELGYPPPALQVPFFDDRGQIGIVDYWWPEARIIGEFDGAVKYQRADMLDGMTPAEVAWREKQREDRLRRRCDGFFRAIWAEAVDPPRLDAVLRASGLRPEPRVKRTSRGSPTPRAMSI